MLKNGAKKLALASLLTACLVPSPSLAAGAGPEKVDLELVIATDSSGSIGDQEAQVQREGVAAAFRNPEIAKIISLGVHGKIAVAYLDWSNQFDNTVVVDWMIIRNKETSEEFAEALVSQPRTYGRRTHISSAIISGMELIENNSYEGTRRTIDISGDGPNNGGLPLAPVREEAIAKGITINGLPIIIDDGGFGNGTFGDIDQYYARCVIGGRGAFAIVARGFNDFARAVRRKLILEISDIVPETRYAQATNGPIRALPPPVGVLRAPAERDQNCDEMRGGFGGGGFRGFGR